MERLTKPTPGGPGEYHTKRLAAAIDRLGELEDKIKSGELVEVVRCWDFVSVKSNDEI